MTDVREAARPPEEADNRDSSLARTRRRFRRRRLVKAATATVTVAIAASASGYVRPSVRPLQVVDAS
jgi:hypothetical protein